MNAQTAITASTPETRGQKQAAEIAAALRSRASLIWIITKEEPRVEQYLFTAAAQANYLLCTWDCAQGARDIAGRQIGTLGETQDPGLMIDFIRRRSEQGSDRNVWVMRDLHAWLSGPVGTMTQRALRNLAYALPRVPLDRAQSVIIVSPSSQIPEELQGQVLVIDWPLPDRAEIASILNAAVNSLRPDMKEAALAHLALNGNRELAIDAAVGLSGDEAQACYSKSLVQLKRIDPAAVASEKKRVIAKERVLELSDPLPGGLSAVGGLEAFKAWLLARKTAYSKAARDYGLPRPKGVLLVGVSGAGKSLSAKATATALECPLIRMDLGGMKSKYVGESEQTIRRSFKTIEAVGRCVVWIDELEKALGGATQGAADGGVASDALGALLSWMQERTSEAFIIATSNDVSALPPELLRKGRFDEMFFVDLPTQIERVAILSAAMRAHGRDLYDIDAQRVAGACIDYTGAEIANIVPDALFTAFNDGARAITTDDLLAAAATVVPLSKTASEKIAALRTWAKGRARPASAAQVESAPTSHLLDI